MRFYLFTCFWSSWVFVATHGLSLIEVNRGYYWLWCVSFLLRWLFLLQSTGSRVSVVVALGHVESSWTRDLTWQADSYPLDHKGSRGCEI